MHRPLCIILVLFFASSLIFAQDVVEESKISGFSLSSYSGFSLAQTMKGEEGEMAYPFEPVPKNMSVAVAETVGVNVFVWAIAQYFADQKTGAHSYINLDTMKDNLKFWFEWDPNHYITNFFAHPYHGSLYFNAARTNGMDFWSSSFFSLGGSFMWEVFMEHHRPSINDLVMTTTGGMFLGEVLFRYSSLVWDDSATGFERVWREIVGALLNPLGGVNRLIRGDTGRVLSSHNQLRAPVLTSIYWAGNISSSQADITKGRAGGAIEVLTRYGRTFTGGEPRKPFDLFFLQGSVKRTDQTYFSIYAYGLLLGKEFGAKENQNHMVGLFHHYDYIYNETIRLGGTSFCPGIYSQFRLSPKTSLSLIGQVGWMVLGASNNEYISAEEETSALGRDYSYGTGLTAKFDVGFVHQKFGSVILRYALYKIYILEGVDGSDRLNLFQARLRIPIWRGLGAGIVYTVYRRNSHFVAHEDIKQRLFSLNYSISIEF